MSTSHYLICDHHKEAVQLFEDGFPELEFFHTHLHCHTNVVAEDEDCFSFGVWRYWTPDNKEEMKKLVRGHEWNLQLARNNPRHILNRMEEARNGLEGGLYKLGWKEFKELLEAMGNVLYCFGLWKVMVLPVESHFEVCPP